MRRSGRSRIVTDAALLRHADAALVLGAGVLADGRPSLMLSQRVRAGVDLVRCGTVRRLVLSGDGAGSRGHDEVAVMAAIATDLGMAESALVKDRLGLSTFESCIRAQKELGASCVIVVTQQFHAPRAAYLARRAGLDAQTLGLPDLDVYGKRVVYPLIARELLAWAKALVESR